MKDLLSEMKNDSETFFKVSDETIKRLKQFEERSQTVRSVLVEWLVELDNLPDEERKKEVLNRIEFMVDLILEALK